MSGYGAEASAVDAQPNCVSVSGFLSTYVLHVCVACGCMICIFHVSVILVCVYFHILVLCPDVAVTSMRSWWHAVRWVVISLNQNACFNRTSMCLFTLEATDSI
jgi:hypothetical protein